MCRTHHTCHMTKQTGLHTDTGVLQWSLDSTLFKTFKRRTKHSSQVIQHHMNSIKCVGVQKSNKIRSLHVVKFNSFSVKDPVMILGKEKFLRIFLSTTLKFWGTLDAGMCSSRSISKSTGAVKEKRGKSITYNCYNDGKLYLRENVKLTQVRLMHVTDFQISLSFKNALLIKVCYLSRFIH